MLVDEALSAMDCASSDLYSELGRPSIPPEHLLRAMLLQAFYSIRSERRLMERLDDDLLLRWFVGLGIEFGRQGSGEFRFGAVVAALRCSYATASMAFTWHGSDEGDEVWAELDDDGSISREIAFHNSDETTFKARRW